MQTCRSCFATCFVQAVLIDQENLSQKLSECGGGASVGGGASMVQQDQELSGVVASQDKLGSNNNIKEVGNNIVMSFLAK